MKKTEEIIPVLMSIWLFNRSHNERDIDVELVIDYALRTFAGANTNFLALVTAGKSKEQLRAAALEILEENTNLKQYKEEYENVPDKN